MIPGTKIYKVTIVNGKIDNFKPTDAKNVRESGVSVLLGKDLTEKARAYVRFQEVCRALTKGLDDMVEISNTLETTVADTIPTSMTFKLVYSQADGMFVYVDEGTEGAEEIRDNKFILKGDKAIKYLIKDTLEREDYNVIAEFFDGAEVKDKKGNALGMPKGYNLVDLTINKVSGETITVEEILEK